MVEAVRLIATMLSPFAPHLAEEIAESYGAKESLQATPWPSFDPVLVVEEKRTYAVQVNGKLRGEVEVPADAEEAEVREAAEANERVRAYLDGKTIRKVIFVRNRLLNFVVSG